MVRMITSSANTENRTENKSFTSNPTDTIPKCIFTPTDIVELLQSLEELNGVEIYHEILEDGRVRFVIGENVYSGIGL